MAEPPFCKTLLKTEALQKYILNVSTYGREHELLKRIREVTFQNYGNKAKMVLPADEGLFISMILKLMNAKKTLEIGVFTCYSLLTTALALPDDGQIVAVDISREAYEVGLPFIREAGLDHKINFIESDASSAIIEMLKTEEEQFDFVLVDADKPNYKKYHEQLLKLVKVGGVIAYDNTLWCGTVAEVEVEDRDNGTTAESFLDNRTGIIDLNKSLASDPRIEISHISIGDGLTLCRRIV